jgi:MOSC domain-containing protein YiiM
MADHLPVATGCHAARISSLSMMETRHHFPGWQVRRKSVAGEVRHCEDGGVGAQVIAVNVGRPEVGSWTGRVGRSAIRKRPVAGPVRVGREGLAGDRQCDRKYHGSPDNAVYAFAREDLDYWAKVLGRPVPDGQFGENLTTSGIDVNDARVGERWRVGTALLEVAYARTPCLVFQNFMGHTGYDETAWMKRFTAVGRPGPYLRVLEDGVVERGDPVEVEHRPDHEITVSTVFRALRVDRSLLAELRDVPGLTDVVRQMAARAG